MTFPEPEIDLVRPEREVPQFEATPVTAHLTPRAEKETGMVERIRGVWTTVERVVEELILAAEALYGPKTGDQKKRYVRDKAMEFLRELEGRKDFFPSPVEGLVFRAIAWALDFIIERVFREAVKRGLLNASA